MQAARSESEHEHVDGQFDVTASPVVPRWLFPAVLTPLAVAAGVVVTRWLSPYFPDDAFITFRYARNLADGHGWVYNTGEVGETAATSPLHTILLTLSHRVHHDMAANANILFATALAGTGIFTALAFRRLGAGAAGIVAAGFLFVSPALLLTRGMESATFLLFTAAALYFFLAERPVLVGVTLGLLTLTRGEGVLLAAVLAAVWLGRRRRHLRGLLIGLAAVTMPWAVYATVVLDSLLPDTLAGKTAQGASGFWGSGPVFLRGLWGIPRIFGYRTWAVAVATLAALGLAVVVIVRTVLPLALPLTAFAIAHVSFYGLIFRVPDYTWYYALPWYAGLVLAAVAVVHLARRGWGQRDVLAGTLAVTGSIAVLGAGIIQMPPSATVVYEGYRWAGTWLHDNAPERASVAAAEIGILGWFSERPTTDFLGLLSEESASELRQGDLATWIRREPPDYFVVHRPLWALELPAVSQAWFPFAFREVAAMGHLRILERTSSPAEGEEMARSVRADVGRYAAAHLSMRGVGIHSDEDVAAIDAVLRVYLARDDLHASFGSPMDVDLGGLLHWAGVRVAGVDPAASVLAPHRDVILSLHSRVAEHGGVRLSL